jgi:flavin-dependent dehydrogenase
MKYDVIIAGAGPAGSMAALVLSRAGKRVLVLEKSHFPRTKVCGYSLNPRSWSVWERHGLTAQFKTLPHFDIAGFTLEKEGVPVIHHRFRSQRTRTIDRGTLDAWLAEEAQNCGAEYRFGATVLAISPTAVVSDAGTFAAPYVIGADGRNSVVGRLSHLANPGRACDRIGWQAFIDLPALNDHVHMNIFPEGYYGMNRIDAERTTITIVLFAKARTTPEKIFHRYLPGAKRVTNWKGVSPISKRTWQLTNGRAWLVGDAVRLLEPLTGEGIYSALATGEMVAEHLLSIERLGVKRAMRNYRRQHRHFYGSRTAVNSFVRWSLGNSTRSMWMMKALQLWPAVISQMVEWVQKPEPGKSHLEAALDVSAPPCVSLTEREPEREHRLQPLNK